MCHVHTRRHSICLQMYPYINVSVGLYMPAPFCTHEILLHMYLCAWMRINQHLPTVSIALYLFISIYLQARVCISHNRYSKSLIWWVKWSGLFDQPSGYITTRASGGA